MAKDLPVVQLGDSDTVRVGAVRLCHRAPFKLDTRSPTAWSVAKAATN